jgi:hypothetical protein
VLELGEGGRLQSPDQILAQTSPPRTVTRQW